MKKATVHSLPISVWIKVPRRWLFVPSLSQLLANDPSIISDTQSADKWRDLDEIKDNCNISLIDRPPPIFARTWSRDQKVKRWPEVLLFTKVEYASHFIETTVSSCNYQDQYILLFIDQTNFLIISPTLMQLVSQESLYCRLKRTFANKFILL